MLEEVKKRPIQQIDYIGFEFNGIHSSQIGVYRTTESNRYNDSFLPTIQDQTTPIPGADGTYFYNSYYTQKPIELSISFDGLSEKNIRELKLWLSEKQPRRLIFDESPYKYYLVKITGSPSLSFLPFDEPCDEDDDGAFLATETYYLPCTDALDDPSKMQNYTSEPYYKRRVYKGDGKLSFIAYNPFGMNLKQYLDDFDDQKYTNKLEWAPASGLLKNANENDIEWNKFLSEDENYAFYVYNGGDFETDFKITISSSQSSLVLPAMKLQIAELDEDGMEIERVTYAQFENFNIPETSVRINTKLQIIEGMENGLPTGNIYSGKKLAGVFPKLPKGKCKIILIFETSINDIGFTIDYQNLYI